MSNEPVLQQSVRFGAEYVSSELNVKFAGIIRPGIYRGYTLSPGGVMAVLVGHDNGENRSVAVVERDGYSISVLLDDPGLVTIPAKGLWHICIEALYTPRLQGYQRIVARDRTEAHHVVLGAVSVTDNGLEILPSMISLQGRQNAIIPSTGDLAAQEKALREEMAVRTARTKQRWTLADQIAENGILSLPSPYIVGSDSLLLAYDGLLLDSTNYAELGSPGTVSTQIKLLFAAPAGSEFHSIIFGASSPTGVDVLTALANATDRANAAAAKAEQAAAIGSELNQLNTKIDHVAETAVYVGPSA